LWLLWWFALPGICWNVLQNIVLCVFMRKPHSVKILATWTVILTVKTSLLNYFLVLTFATKTLFCGAAFNTSLHCSVSR
jgi:hypothetical protein